MANPFESMTVPGPATAPATPANQFSGMAVKQDSGALFSIKAPEGDGVLAKTGRVAVDTLSSFAQGVYGFEKMVGDLYGLITGDMDNALSRRAKAGIEQNISEKSSQLRAKEEDRSKAIQSADSTMRKAWEYVKTTTTDPALLANAVSEQMFNLLSSGGTGSLVKVGVSKALINKMGADAAARLATKAGVGAAVAQGAAMQGADVGGDQYDQLLVDVAAMTPEQAAANPHIADLLEDGADLDDAKLAYVLTQARKTAAGAAAISLAANTLLPGSQTIERALVGGATRTGSRIAGAAAGAAGEMLSESAEEVGGQGLSNLLGDRPLETGLGEVLGQSLVVGGVPGAAAGFLSTSPVRDATKLVKDEASLQLADAETGVVRSTVQAAQSIEQAVVAQEATATARTAQTTNIIEAADMAGSPGNTLSDTEEQVNALAEANQKAMVSIAIADQQAQAAQVQAQQDIQQVQAAQQQHLEAGRTLQQITEVADAIEKGTEQTSVGAELPRAEAREDIPAYAEEVRQGPGQPADGGNRLVTDGQPQLAPQTQPEDAQPAGLEQVQPKLAPVERLIPDYWGMGPAVTLTAPIPELGKPAGDTILVSQLEQAGYVMPEVVPEGPRRVVTLDAAGKGTVTETPRQETIQQAEPAGLVQAATEQTGTVPAQPTGAPNEEEAQRQGLQEIGEPAPAMASAVGQPVLEGPAVAQPEPIPAPQAGLEQAGQGEVVAGPETSQTGQELPVTPASNETLMDASDMAAAEAEADMDVATGFAKEAEAEAKASTGENLMGMGKRLISRIMGLRMTVNGRRQLTAEEIAVSRNSAQQVFDSLGIPVMWDNAYGRILGGGIFRLKDGATITEQQARELLTKLRERVDSYTHHSPLITVLLQSIRIPGGIGWEGSISQRTRNELIEAAQSPISWAALNTGALSTNKLALPEVARHIDIYLHQGRAKKFGGTAIGEIGNKVTDEAVNNAAEEVQKGMVDSAVNKATKTAQVELEQRVKQYFPQGDARANAVKKAISEQKKNPIDVGEFAANLIGLGVDPNVAENLAEAIDIYNRAVARAQEIAKEGRVATVRPEKEKSTPFPGIKPLIESIINGSPEQQANPAWRKQQAMDFFTKNGLTPEQADEAYGLFEEQFKDKWAKAAKKAAETVLGQMKKPQRKALRGVKVKDKATNKKVTLEERIQQMISTGVIDTPKLLEEIAEAQGWRIPTEQEIAEVKELARQERALRSHPDGTEDPMAEVVTQTRRNELRKKMRAAWSKFSRPSPLNFKGGREARADITGEFIVANLLNTVGFATKQAHDLFFQGLIHRFTSSVSNAILTNQEANPGSRPWASAKFWGDMRRIFSPEARYAIRDLQQAGVAGAAAFVGKGKIRPVEGLVAPFSIFEATTEAARKAREEADVATGEDKAFKEAKAAALTLGDWIGKLMSLGLRGTRSGDAGQGEFAENQYVREQMYRQLREDLGKTQEEAAAIVDQAWADHNARYMAAMAQANNIFEAKGVTPTDLELKAAVHALMRFQIYQQMEGMGLDASSVKAEAERLRQTVGWNMPEPEWTPGWVVGLTPRLIERFGRFAGLSIPMGKFSNVMAIATNRALSVGGLGLFDLGQRVLGGERSAWMTTQEQRTQRKVEAAVGLSLFGAVAALALSGAVRVWNKGPDDPEDRELWEKDGHRPGTIEFYFGEDENGHRKFIPFSTQSGIFSYIRALLGGIGALQDAMDRKRKEAERKVEYAERRGLPISDEHIAPSVEDLFGAFGAGMWQAALGSRTAGGAARSLSREENVVPDIKQAIASQIATYIPMMPQAQQVQRMRDIRIDYDRADFTDYILPTSEDPQRRYNFFHDDIAGDGVQRAIQTLTGGTYYGMIHEGDADRSRPYEILREIRWRPTPIRPNEYFVIDGTYRPLTDEEFVKVDTLYGSYLKTYLSEMYDPGMSKIQKEIWAGRVGGYARRMALHDGAGAASLDTERVGEIEKSSDNPDNLAPQKQAKPNPFDGMVQPRQAQPKKNPFDGMVQPRQ